MYAHIPGVKFVVSFTSMLLHGASQSSVSAVGPAQDGLDVIVIVSVVPLCVPAIG
jgi:hypothetical protein